MYFLKDPHLPNRSTKPFTNDTRTGLPMAWCLVPSARPTTVQHDATTFTSVPVAAQISVIVRGTPFCRQTR